MKGSPFTNCYLDKNLRSPNLDVHTSYGITRMDLWYLHSNTSYCQCWGDFALLF